MPKITGGRINSQIILFIELAACLPLETGCTFFCQPEAALMGEFYKKERPEFSEVQFPVTTRWLVTSLGLSFLARKIKDLGRGSYRHLHSRNFYESSIYYPPSLKDIRDVC